MCAGWTFLARPPALDLIWRKAISTFLVAFQDLGIDQYADAYFGLLEDLEAVFQRPVDLVVDSAIQNPYFRQAVDSTRTPIYEA